MAHTAVDFTERLLMDAGISSGMHVLDVGCGRGDVTFMLAKLVGETGEVIGVDRDTAALVIAREQGQELGVSNVSFVDGDIGALSPKLTEFDAAVGRRVLMYQPDHVAAITQIMGAVRAGGLIVFQEHDSNVGPHLGKPLTLHTQVHQWLWRTVEREGANISMGLNLYSVLERAGLDVEHVRSEAVVLTPTSPSPVARILRSMLPRMIERGVVAQDEIDIDALCDRLEDEQRGADTACLWDMMFGAWATKPSA